MKKLLILALVLGFASMASATIMLSLDGALDVEEITIAPSDWVTIDIYDDGQCVPPDYLCYLDIGMISEGGYSLANARLGPAAGDFPASYNMYQLNDWDEVEFNQAWAVGSTPTAGAIFLVDLHCELKDVDVQVGLYDAGGTLVDSMVIHQIPEPATIALLGLGGLLLRRRK